MTDRQSGNHSPRYRCVEPRLGEDILKYGEDGLDAGLSKELSDHLSICRHCQILLELDAALRERVLASHRGRFLTSVLQRPSAWVVVAAMLLLAFGLQFMGPQDSIGGAPSVGFIENTNQLDSEVRFFSPGSNVSVFFLDDGLIFDIQNQPQDSLLAVQYRAGKDRDQVDYSRMGHALRLTFRNPDPELRIVAESELSTQYNYHVGNDSLMWRSGIPSFASLVYRNLWPGVDLIFREENGTISYELHAEKGASPPDRLFDFTGADDLLIQSNGSLSMRTRFGDLVDVPPGTSGDKGLFLWSAQEGYERSGHLVQVDAVPEGLSWSGYLGGYALKSGVCLDLTENGEPVIGGYIARVEYPSDPGPYNVQQTTSDFDAFVAKMSADGRRLSWLTILGGHEDRDMITDLTLTRDGRIVVCGFSEASDFPVTEEAWDRINGEIEGEPNQDSFVTIVTANGERLLHSTFLGGDDIEIPHSLALDSGGNIVVSGSSRSSSLGGASIRHEHGSSPVDDVSNAFVAALSPDCRELLWSASLGGAKSDIILDMALAADGGILIAGMTASEDFPTTEGSFGLPFGGGAWDAFACKLSADGSRLIWSGLLGGSGDWDYAQGILESAVGDVFLVGETFSSDFPSTPGAFDESFNEGEGKGGNDVFVARISGDGTTLLWSSFLGGSSTERGIALALDRNSNPVLVGHSASRDFPVAGGVLSGEHGGGVFDGFIVRMASDGRRILDAGFLGGGGDDWILDVTLDTLDRPIVVGVTSSLDFPVTPGVFDETHNGLAEDVFISRMPLLSSGSDLAGGS